MVLQEVMQPQYLGAFIAAMILPGSSVLRKKDFHGKSHLPGILGMIALAMLVTVLLMVVIWRII